MIGCEFKPRRSGARTALKLRKQRFSTTVHSINKTDSDCVWHGLCAEYVEYEAMLRSLLPPTLRGKLDQMNKASREQISHEVGGLLGHGNDHTISAYYGSFRVPTKGAGRGERIGGIIVNAEADTMAQIFINPCPIADKQGRYRVYSETERAALSISVTLEGPGVSGPDAEAWARHALSLRPPLTPPAAAIKSIIGVPIGSS